MKTAKAAKNSDMYERFLSIFQLLMASYKKSTTKNK